MFAFRRTRRAKPDPSESTPEATALVHDAENIVRLAWRRDLYELRGLAEEQLQAAVADGLEAYEALRRAQRDSEPRGIADAHMTFETATRLAQTKTEHRDRLDALIEAESDGCSAASAAPPDGTAWTAGGGRRWTRRRSWTRPGMRRP